MRRGRRWKMRRGGKEMRKEGRRSFKYYDIHHAFSLYQNIFELCDIMSTV
jgi:hypothetical protein